MLPYQSNQKDFRPWGHFEILKSGFLSDGREFCDKRLVISPYKILSLQSHDYREEIWHVQSGHLTAIKNWRRYKIGEGREIHIPAKTIHTIANMNDAPLVLYERQIGLCREDDIIRYADCYGRPISAQGPGWLFFSMKLYRILLNQLAENTV